MFVMCFCTYLLLFSGCSSSVDGNRREPISNNEKKEQIKDTETGIKDKKQLLDKASKESPNNPTTKRSKTIEGKTHNYRCQNKKVIQYLKVRYLDKKKIEFDLSIDGSCKLSFKGMADIPDYAYLGAGSDEDEETGISYFVDEYVFKKADGCYLEIRIGKDEEDKNKAAIVEAGCKFECPILSSTMRLVDK